MSEPLTWDDLTPKEQRQVRMMQLAVDSHVHEERSQLSWIWWTLAAILLVTFSNGAISGFNLRETTRNAPSFLAEHEHTQSILCGWIDSQPGDPPDTIVTLCEGLPKETP